jgi:hypothetical protein
MPDHSGGPITTGREVRLPDATQKEDIILRQGRGRNNELLFSSNYVDDNQGS